MTFTAPQVDWGREWTEVSWKFWRQETHLALEEEASRGDPKHGRPREMVQCDPTNH